MTDEAGRLVFMPAAGLGYSPTSAPLTTSDTNGWADDICDGPVSATIDPDGTRLMAEPAWVIVTPANYGPGLPTGVVTAWDSSRMGWDPKAAAGGDPAVAVSFATDILPVFSRLVDMQWVNAGFLYSNGWGSDGDYLRSPTVERLADPSPANTEYRNQVFTQFRDPSYAVPQPDSVPLVYGDGVAIPAQSAYQWLTVTPLRYAQLRRWAEGDFEDDRGEYGPLVEFDDLAVDQQPAALDRAGLESCLGGAYHPGIEVPWTLRLPSMWAGPLRLKMRSREVEATNYGDMLTPEVAGAGAQPCAAGAGLPRRRRWRPRPVRDEGARSRRPSCHGVHVGGASHRQDFAFGEHTVEVVEACSEKRAVATDGVAEVERHRGQAGARRTRTDPASPTTSTVAASRGICPP